MNRFVMIKQVHYQSADTGRTLFKSACIWLADIVRVEIEGFDSTTLVDTMADYHSDYCPFSTYTQIIIWAKDGTRYEVWPDECDRVMGQLSDYLSLG